MVLELYTTLLMVEGIKRVAISTVDSLLPPKNATRAEDNNHAHEQLINVQFGIE